MSIARGLARAAKAAKRHNKNKSRQGNDLVGNRGEDGSLMTDKDWSNKMSEEKHLNDAPPQSSDIETLLQQLNNNDINLYNLSADELVNLRNKLDNSLKELDGIIEDEIKYMDRRGDSDVYHRMLNDKDTIETHLLEVERVYGELFEGQ